jgi:hypothetical protein
VVSADMVLGTRWAPQGAQVQAVVQIPDIIRYATSKLIRGQEIGAAIGAAVGLVLGLVMAVKGRSRARESKLQPPGQPQASA